ncbi:hypothetical protein R6Q59_005437 [Mikania micrantha]|uniref:DUF7054 domain-containing protein n=1 Tax=Mikania micrantha TaxID=192012 RepID=A0A5N6Q4B6_9ASTR|nr:hypothetical protein E3N88_01937 [Mikania micrantha]
MLSLRFKKMKDRVMKAGCNRILININVVGSCGPIRLVVREDMVVASVIETALKSYAQEGRFPVLGTQFSGFFLYTPVAGTEALNPREMIGSFGVRTFMLCKKPDQVAEMTKKSSDTWKSWFRKTLSMKVTPH